MTPEGWIAFAGLILTIFVVSGTGLWALSRQMTAGREALSKQFAAGLKSLRDEFERDGREVRELVESRFREAQEAPRALREKITQVELFMRDEFVKQKDYDRDQDKILLALRQLEDAVGRRFDDFKTEIKEAIKGIRSNVN